MLARDMGCGGSASVPVSIKRVACCRCMRAAGMGIRLTRKEYGQWRKQ
jgi:hypothetical protein